MLIQEHVVRGEITSTHVKHSLPNTNKQANKKKPHQNPIITM